MEVSPEAGNGCVVVPGHGEAKTDHQDQSHKVCEMKSTTVFAGSERGFDAVPNHQNGGKGPEQVLAHTVENAKILLHQRVDRLQHCVEEVHGVSVVLCSGP